MNELLGQVEKRVKGLSGEHSFRLPNPRSFSAFQMQVQQNSLYRKAADGRETSNHGQVRFRLRSCLCASPQSSAQWQAPARSPDLARTRLVGTIKAVEDMRQIRFANAHSGVLDFHNGLPVLRIR